MACNIYKFNENNINLVSNQKQNLRYNTNLPTLGNHFYYGFIYNNTNSNWTCIYNSTKKLQGNNFVEKRDFKILLRSSKVYLFLSVINIQNGEDPTTTIKVYNCYFNVPNFVNGQYYEIEVIIDYLSGLQNHQVKINGITYNISGYHNDWAGVPGHDIKSWTSFDILYNINNQCYIGDSFQYYTYYKSIMNNLDDLYNGLVHNVGNWAICYHIRGYYGTDGTNQYFNKVFQALFKGTPDYQADFALYGVNFQLIHNTSFSYDTQEVSEELFCCDDCKHKYLTTINLENIQLGTKSKIDSFSIGTVENININNTGTISCTKDWNLLNGFYFPISIYLYNNFNIKDYFVLFNTTDECFDMYISVNICNAKLQLSGENIGFDLSYEDNTECCDETEIIIKDRDAEYSCCLESYYINKDFLYYQKYYLINVEETRKQFYQYLSNVNLLYNKYYYIWHKYYSIYYIRELENKYCYNTYDIKSYITERNCRYIDIKCLSEDMSSIKNCCEDIEFELLCKCKDEYPNNLPIKVINIDIKSFSSITLTNELNNEIDNYNCCEEGLGVQLIAIERDLNIATINYSFNNTTGEFTNFVISGLAPSVNVPIKENINIKLKYCGKYDIIKRIEINYYSSCTEDRIDIIEKDVFKEHEIEYGEILNNQELDIKIISLSDSSKICCSNLVNQDKTFYPISDISYEIEDNPIIKINNITPMIVNPNRILRIDYNIVSSYIDLSKLKKISPCKYIYEKIVKIRFKLCSLYYEVFANIRVIINRDESLYEIKFLQYYNNLFDDTITSSIPITNNTLPIGGLVLINVFNIQHEECCDGTCTASIKYKKIKILYYNSSNQVIILATQEYDLNDGTVSFIPNHNINITYIVEHENVMLNKYNCGVKYKIMLSKTSGNLLNFPSEAVRAELYLTYEAEICGKRVIGTRKILIVNA